MFHGIAGGLDPAADSELAVDGGQVPLHSPRAQVEPRGDLLVTQAVGQEPQHLGLAGGQVARERAGRAAGGVRERRRRLG